MEYLYGLLFGTEPKQSDADASHALRTKLEALPGDRDAQITLTAAELRILKEATTTTRAPQKHGGGDELFVRMHSNLTEDLDPSTADAVVDAYGASPLKPNPLAETKAEPRDAAAAKGVQKCGGRLDLRTTARVERPEGAPEDARGGVVGGQRLGL